MGSENLSPDVAFINNLTVISALLELAGPSLTEITGGEELSNQVGGVSQEQRDFQELVAARFENHLNAVTNVNDNQVTSNVK